MQWILLVASCLLPVKEIGAQCVNHLLNFSGALEHLSTIFCLSLSLSLARSPEEMPAHPQAKQKAAEKEAPLKVTLHSPKVCVLPPADWLSKVQFVDTPVREKQPPTSLQRKQGYALILMVCLTS